MVSAEPWTREQTDKMKTQNFKGSEESSLCVSCNEMKTSFDCKYGLKFVCESLKNHRLTAGKGIWILTSHVCFGYKHDCYV